MTRRAAVIGRPIAQSLSPLIHSAWIAAAGLDATYEAFAPGDETAFTALMNRLAAEGAAGVNVTAPYKGAALGWAEANGLPVGRGAREAASVNLLVFGPAGRAESTDGEGMIAALDDQARGWRDGGSAVVLGAGGAARAAVHALIGAGVADIRVVNRTLSTAEALAGQAGAGVSAWGLERTADAFDGAGVLINAATGAAPPDLTPLNAGAAVLDMTYRPLKTPLLQRAAAAGLRPVDGLAMLIGQARPSFEALFGVPVSDIDVRALALAALERQP